MVCAGLKQRQEVSISGDLKLSDRLLRVDAHPSAYHDHPRDIRASPKLSAVLPKVD